MSNQPKPFEELDIYNSVNYPGSAVSANLLNFPVAQGTETMPYGIIWGDGSYQNSANPGGYSLTVQDGTTTVTNVSDINVTNGTLTNNGGGSVSITTGGGGGGGVQNPMTSDLDGGGFDINNLTNISINNEATLPTINTKTINNSDPLKYYNQGAVAPGGNNLYYVCKMDPKANGEAHCLVVSRCLDPGFKQTVVFSVSAFENKASIDVQVNLAESDTPIFAAIAVGYLNGTTETFVAMEVAAPSSTWEFRVYENQDDKGTGTGYGSTWEFISPATVVPNVTLTVLAGAPLYSLNPYGTKTFTGNHVIQGSVDSLSLKASDFVSAGGDVTSGNNTFVGNALYTNEIRDNGFAPIGVFNSISMQNNDIQSANFVGALGFVGAALNVTIPIGHPTNGPIYVDTATNSVGVGISVPNAVLDVAKSIMITSTSAPRADFFSTTASSVQSQIISNDTGLGGADIYFQNRADAGTLGLKMVLFQDGRLRLTLNRIENVANPISAQDVATKDYVDSSIPTGFVFNPMTSDLDGGTFEINNISDPTLAQDAATKNYVDQSIAAIPPVVPWVPYNLKWINDSNQGITAPSPSQWYDVNNLNVVPINSGYVLGPAGSVTFPVDGTYMVRFYSTLGSAANGEWNAKSQVLYTAAFGFPTEGVISNPHYVKKFSNTLAQGGGITCEGMVQGFAGDTVRPQIYWTSEPPGLVPQLGNNYGGTFSSANTTDGTEFLVWRIG